MKISQLLFALPIAVITVVANADVSPDRTGICYIFQGDKIAKRGTCLISAEISHGEAFRELSFGGKTYKLYENGVSLPIKNTLNGKRAESYFRETKFYTPVSAEKLQSSFLICYKAKSLDVCYREQN